VDAGVEPLDQESPDGNAFLQYCFDDLSTLTVLLLPEAGFIYWFTESRRTRGDTCGEEG
jgi:hypothetical protein